MVADGAASRTTGVTVFDEDGAPITASNPLPVLLGANSGVDIGDVDVTSIPDAVVDTNYFQVTITSADATTATQVKAKTAAKKIHVTSLVISTNTAMNIQLQSDNGSPQIVMEQMYFDVNGGIGLTFPERFPLQVNTNEDLDVIASIAGNISVTVTGYVV